MASLEGKKIKDTYKSLLKVNDNGELEVTGQEITDGAGNSTGVSLNTSGDVTATGTVAFGSLKDSGENITITKFVDEADGIALNDNDTSIPTSAAVKDYVDTNVTAQDLDITDGTNNGSVDLDSQSLTFTGDAGVTATVSGQTLTLDSSALQAQITSNDSDIAGLDTRLTTAESNISSNDTDIAALQTADTTLQANIDAEETARIAADSSLQANINSEASTRAAADTTLQTNIDNEEAARITADSGLQTQITSNDSDITALQAADTTLQSNIDAEEAARIAADTTLQSNIDSEASTRATADTTLQSNIDSEATARASADTALQTQITSNDTDISGLDTRLTTAEGNITSNDSDISALDGRLTTAEGNISSNDTDIAGLDTRLTTAEGNITSNDTDIATLQSDKQDISEKGQANGYAPLDSGAKIPIANLPDSVVGQVEYQGTWNASTNTPTLPSASTVKGHYYVVSTAGTYLSITYAVGDWIISNGTDWEKVDNTDAVTSVFGRLGNVVANESDYSSFYPLISDLDTTNSNVSTNAANIASNDTDIANLQSDKYDKTGGTISGSVTVTGDLSATNLTGTVSATSVLADGVTATTQTSGDNSTKVATTAYVDAAVTAEDLDFAGDSGTGAVDLDSQTFTIAGTANEIETSASGQTVTIGLPSSVTVGTLNATTISASGSIEVADAQSIFFSGTGGDYGKMSFGDSDPDVFDINFYQNSALSAGLKFSALSEAAGGGKIDIITGGSASVRIENNGNVGIGTSSPTDYSAFGYRTLEVSGSSIDRTGALILSDSAGTIGGTLIANEVTGLELVQPLNRPLLFYTNNTEKVRILPTGGITFNGDTAAANALDDYEEGTWTMGISFGGSTTGITYQDSLGTYTKIGRQVTVNGVVTLSNKGSATGVANLTGLPFTVNANPAHYGSGNSRFQNISHTGQYQAAILVNDTRLQLEQLSVLGVLTLLTDANFANNSSIMVSFSYFV